MEDFVFKLEKVVERKVAYFYTSSPKNSKVSDHDSNPSQTMTLTACPAGATWVWAKTQVDPAEQVVRLIVWLGLESYSDTSHWKAVGVLIWLGLESWFGLG